MSTPTDYPAQVYARAIAIATSAVQAYNAQIALDRAASPPGPLAGCRPVNLNKGLIDNSKLGRLQNQTARDDAAGYPRVTVTLGGGSQPPPRMVTFGFVAGASGADAILPRTVTWTEVVEHEPDEVSDAATTPLESFIDKAFDDAQPKLGVGSLPPLVPLRQFSRNHVSRKDEPAGSPGARTVRRTVGTAEFVPHRNG